MAYPANVDALFLFANTALGFGKALIAGQALWSAIPLAFVLLAATFLPSRPRGLQIFSGTVVLFTAAAALRVVASGPRGIAELAFATHATLIITLLAILGLIIVFTEHPIGGLGWWLSDPLVVSALGIPLLGMLFANAPSNLISWLTVLLDWLALVAVFGFVHWLIAQVTHSAKRAAHERRVTEELKQAAAAYAGETAAEAEAEPVQREEGEFEEPAREGEAEPAHAEERLEERAPKPAKRAKQKPAKAKPAAKPAKKAAKSAVKKSRPAKKAKRKK